MDSTGGVLPFYTASGYTEHGGKMPVLTSPKTERRRQTADSRRQFAADASGAGAPLLPSAVCNLPSPPGGKKHNLFPCTV